MLSEGRREGEMDMYSLSIAGADEEVQATPGKSVYRKGRA
jgi:hypothetical protein